MVLSYRKFWKIWKREVAFSFNSAVIEAAFRACYNHTNSHNAYPEPFASHVQRVSSSEPVITMGSSGCAHTAVTLCSCPSSVCIQLLPLSSQTCTCYLINHISIDLFLIMQRYIKLRTIKFANLSSVIIRATK